MLGGNFASEGTDQSMKAMKTIPPADHIKEPIRKVRFSKAVLFILGLSKGAKVILCQRI